jgi:ferredoxin/flavodoxin---NADP+ reductase
MLGFKKIKVLQNKMISSNAWLLSLDYRPDFIPGQIISLTSDQSIPPRLYSICSAPSAVSLDVLFTVNPNGILSPILAKLKPGDWVWASDPSGQFIMENQPAWWIATGTGIAPFYAMFLSGYKPLRLIQGGRSIEDLYFMNEFVGKIQYQACCSREKNPGVYPGRLTQYLIEIPYLPPDIYYYLCGSSEMVVDVRNILIERGIPFGQIITEIYF